MSKARFEMDFDRYYDAAQAEAALKGLAEAYPACRDAVCGLSRSQTKPPVSPVTSQAITSTP